MLPCPRAPRRWRPLWRPPPTARTATRSGATRPPLSPDTGETRVFQSTMTLSYHTDLLYDYMIVINIIWDYITLNLSVYHHRGRGARLSGRRRRWHRRLRRGQPVRDRARRATASVASSAVKAVFQSKESRVRRTPVSTRECPLKLPTVSWSSTNAKDPTIPESKGPNLPTPKSSSEFVHHP